MDDEFKRKVTDFFELTRSNYLVIERALLESMPDEWQEKLVALLDEMQERIRANGIEPPDAYWVRARQDNRFVSNPIPHYRHSPNLLPKAFCLCGIYDEPCVPDPELAWRHNDPCPHARAKKQVLRVG
jgi:hypothetical protein